ncbi:protein BOLA4, chloroplastic/mitochondrial [Iris pallida]|uniref:Protein BOLA4, chloroplastic/mitochondrial n=1 Tax=Iris pallida TaxID=29817 RepID=A0AAX6HGN4_IRIPA|nr:protein BOLA4, chloroplastic/mitochondrial [Iris pallida]
MMRSCLSSSSPAAMASLLFRSCTSHPPPRTPSCLSSSPISSRLLSFPTNNKNHNQIQRRIKTGGDWESYQQQQNRPCLLLLLLLHRLFHDKLNSMENKIKEQLKADFVTVKDAYGDGRHVSIDVVSTAFEGQSAVNRQRMVYKAIWEELQSTVCMQLIR